MRSLRILVAACCLLSVPSCGKGQRPESEPFGLLPPALQPLAREGKEQFAQGNYLEAEKTFRKVLEKAPNNLYTLSNLGVVLFRAAKFQQSEQVFKKAIAVAPEDGFSHCTLGIVYYSQGKYDDAINELTKALAIDPKNTTAHNYLGIACGQKGWTEAAKKELETATELDPEYRDFPSGFQRLPDKGDFLTPREKEQLKRQQAPPELLK